MKKISASLCLFLLLAGAVYADPIVVRERLGQKFQIVLASNPTTGYKWRLAGKLNKKVVKLVDSKYRGPESKLIGAGGCEVWTFLAAGRGRANIKLKYVRPWEKAARPVKRCSYEIIVK